MSAAAWVLLTADEAAELRSEVLREVAEKIRDGACVFDTAMTIKVAQRGPFSVIAYAQVLIADAIDPDKT